ncbi:MAG: hypothetical protein HY554_19005 [Elusimicrobia bacterium]|nr:hypothetical protein [Elusimicrobiota bacterium]
MKRYLTAAAGIGVALALWGTPVGAKPKDAEGKEGLEKTFPFDIGPDTIDVSGYPKEQQANYKLFERKCSRCHTLARAVNAPYALPEEWEPYVRKMQKKRRSGLDKKSADKIISFLNYDSSVRKKDLIEKKSKEKK